MSEAEDTKTRATAEAALRDELAARAMTEIIRCAMAGAAPQVFSGVGITTGSAQIIAQSAYEIADAMMVARTMARAHTNLIPNVPAPAPVQPPMGPNSGVAPPVTYQQSINEKPIGFG